MSNEDSLKAHLDKSKQRAESTSPTRTVTEVEKRFSFDEADTTRSEYLHVRSTSVPLTPDQLQQRMPGLVLPPIRRKPVLSVDSVSPAIQQHGAPAQRSTTSQSGASKAPGPQSASTGSNSPSRSPAFRRSSNTYLDSLEQRSGINQTRRLSSPHKEQILSPLKTISAIDHGTTPIDQAMDNEDAASRQSSTWRSPQPHATPRKSAENSTLQPRHRSPASISKDLPQLPPSSRLSTMPTEHDEDEGGVQLPPSFLSASPGQVPMLTESMVKVYVALRWAYTLAEMVDWAANQLTDMALPDSGVPEDCKPIVESHLAAKLCDVNLLVNEVQKGLEKHPLYDRLQLGKYSILQRSFADVAAASRTLENAMSNSVAELRAIIAEREVK